MGLYNIERKNVEPEKNIGITSLRIELDRNKGLISSSDRARLLIFSFDILCAINEPTTESNELKSNQSVSWSLFVPKSKMDSIQLKKKNKF